MIAERFVNSPAPYPAPTQGGFRVRAGCQEIWTLALPLPPKVTLGRLLPISSSVKWRWEGDVVSKSSSSNIQHALESKKYCKTSQFLVLSFGCEQKALC